MSSAVMPKPIDPFFRDAKQYYPVTTYKFSRAGAFMALTIDNVKVKFGSGATQEYTEIDTKGDYVAIKIIDVYNQAAAPSIVWTVPGANETVSITFTVSNW